MFELEIYPACLDCRWRELESTEYRTSKGRRVVEICVKAPICKLIEGQEKLKAEKGK